jgi:hypothetical protein
VDELDPTAAVVYDRRWLLETFRRFGLGVRLTVPPAVPGHQWLVLLEKRRANTVDRFPLGSEGTEWLCGATEKPIAQVAMSDHDREAVVTAHDPALRPIKAAEPSGSIGPPPVPPFQYGPFDAILREELEVLKRSWTWRIGRAIVGPIGLLKRAWRRD